MIDSCWGAFHPYGRIDKKFEYSLIPLFQNVDFIYNKTMDFLRNDFEHLTQNDEDYQDNYLKKYNRF